MESIESENDAPILKLPNEILIKIFSVLDRISLCQVCLVSKQWRLVGEDPTLWTSLIISPKKMETVNEFAQCTRLQHLTRVTILCMFPSTINLTCTFITEFNINVKYWLVAIMKVFE